MAARFRAYFTSDSLLRAAREIVIVTIGILIAFALNAWWENHKERRQEQEHLRALASDFERNAGQLGELATAEDRVAKNSLELLRIARSSGEKTPEKIRDLMNGVFSSQRFEPVMGAYDALVNSGLTLIRNDKLRASLANFSATISNRYGERFSDEMYFSFIREFAGRLHIAEEMAHTPVPLAAYLQVLADPKFQDYLAMRSLAEGQTAGYYRGLKQRSEAILEMLKKEMR